MTRSEAFAAGLTHFDTGRPCRYGHAGPRYTSTGSCVACLRSRGFVTLPDNPGLRELRQKLADTLAAAEALRTEIAEAEANLRRAGEIAAEIEAARRSEKLRGERALRSLWASQKLTHRVGFRAFRSDAPALATMAATLQLLREDAAPQAVKYSKPAGGTVWVTLRADPEDHAALKAEANRLLTVRSEAGREARAIDRHVTSP